MQVEDTVYQKNVPPCKNTSGPFSTWAAAGFTSELLPIIPRNAKLRQGTSLELEDRGKTPGKVYASGEWVGFADWAEYEADAGNVTYWDTLNAKYGCGVGLQGRQFPAADIDVWDPQVAALMVELAERHLGSTLERTGQPPKGLLIYRLAPGAEPVKKRRVAFTLPGDDRVHAVEVLGKGQHYVVEGIHPKTRKPYTWTGSPASIGAANLTPITAAQVDQYVEAVAQTVAVLGGSIIENRAQADAAGNVDQEALKTDPKRLAEALDAMGNTIQSYDEWITMCAAIKAALGGDEAHYGIFESWNLLDSRNSPELIRQKWDSLQPPYRVGAEYVYRRAGEAGWAGYVTNVFTPLASPAPAPPAGDDTWDVGFTYTGPDATPEWLTDYVWAEAQERFFHVPTAEVLDEAAMARRFASPGIGVGAKNNPAKLYFERKQRRFAKGLTYLPGAPRLPIVDGSRMANTWTPAPAVLAAAGRTVTDQDVRPWLDHMEYLAPDAHARGLMLDWMAYVIQHPEEKPNWALFLGGKQGIGKGLAFLPLEAGVGPKNKRLVTPDELSGQFTAWAASRLVVVEEMRNFETKAVMNKLKIYITRPPEMIPINDKFQRRYEVPNVACFVFMSNFKDALSLEDGDRRFFVYWSPAEPRPASYYDRLAAYLAEGGSGREDVVAWLLARDVRAFAPIAKGRAPDTADKEAMRAEGGPEAVRLLTELIEGEEEPFHVDVVSLTDIDAWAKSSGRQFSLKHIEEAIRRAGGGPIPNRTGKPGAHQIRVQRGYGKPSRPVRVWACRNLEHWAQQGEAALKREYERGRGLTLPPELWDASAGVTAAADNPPGFSVAEIMGATASQH